MVRLGEEGQPLPHETEIAGLSLALDPTFDPQQLAWLESREGDLGQPTLEPDDQVDRLGPTLTLLIETLRKADELESDLGDYSRRTDVRGRQPAFDRKDLSIG